MTLGAFIYVVGPSGAGKDSLIDGARAVLPADQFIFARRIITRPAGSVGEVHEACTQAEFDQKKAQNEFLVSWRAHDLSYALPAKLLLNQQLGQHVIANGSRNLVAELASKVSPFFVIEVSAPSEVLQARLHARGRESAQGVAQRLHRSVTPYPPGAQVLRINNDKSLDDGIQAFLNAIDQIIHSG
jgi:thymidine phosphorylase